MKHFSDIGTAALFGSFGITVMSALTGCEAPQEQAQNKFLVIEQQPNGKYIVVEEMPTEGETRAIIRDKDANGTVTERFMSEAELQEMARQEYERMQSGESELNAEPSGEGMGLAGTILAVAAGSLLGNIIGNALMGNKNFQRHTDSVNRSAYHQNRVKSGTAGSSTKKSFFGSTKTGTSTGTSSYSKTSSYGG